MTQLQGKLRAGLKAELGAFYPLLLLRPLENDRRSILHTASGLPFRVMFRVMFGRSGMRQAQVFRCMVCGVGLTVCCTEIDLVPGLDPNLNILV